MKCEACNGKGTVIRYMEFPLADEHIICQRCGGSGEVNCNNYGYDYEDYEN